MSRIANCFEKLLSEDKTALIPFFTAGDPQKEITVPLMHALVKAGANIIELGVPFSDPMADGPVIQKASERALLHNMSLNDVMAAVTEFRQQDTTTPVILMGYLNPIEVMGYEVFSQRASKAGVDGVLTVDIPPEEGSEFNKALRDKDIDPIFLLAPTSDKNRIKKITEAANGFIYYVALKGVTGAGNLSMDSVSEKMEEIRQITDMPVGVGFGIKDAATAAKMSKLADAVVVGSALVSRVEHNQNDIEAIISQMSAIISSMREAIDA